MKTKIKYIFSSSETGVTIWVVENGLKHWVLDASLCSRSNRITISTKDKSKRGWKVYCEKVKNSIPHTIEFEVVKVRK